MKKQAGRPKSEWLKISNGYTHPRYGSVIFKVLSKSSNHGGYKYEIFVEKDGVSISKGRFITKISMLRFLSKIKQSMSGFG